MRLLVLFSAVVMLIWPIGFRWIVFMGGGTLDAYEDRQRSLGSANALERALGRLFFGRSIIGGFCRLLAPSFSFSRFLLINHACH